jgi:hypothetical protein
MSESASRTAGWLWTAALVVMIIAAAWQRLMLWRRGTRLVPPAIA